MNELLDESQGGDFRDCTITTQSTTATSTQTSSATTSVTTTATTQLSGRIECLEYGGTAYLGLANDVACARQATTLNELTEKCSSLTGSLECTGIPNVEEGSSVVLTDYQLCG